MRRSRTIYAGDPPSFESIRDTEKLSRDVQYGALGGGSKTVAFQADNLGKSLQASATLELGYSLRKASAGSTSVARLAGKRQAAAAVVSVTSATMAIVAGS